MALRALKTDEEIAGVPLDQPILVELPGGTVDEPETIVTKKDEDKPSDASKLQEQLEAAQAAQRASDERAATAERKAAEATQRAQEREREADEARKRNTSLEGDVINGGLTAAQSERDAAKLALQAAGEAGDWKSIADAQSRIGRAEARILNYEAGAAEIAERKETKVERPEPVVQKTHDPLAAVESNPALLPAEKEWLKNHPDAIVDSKRNNELGVAYDRAVKKGLVRGTPAYFADLEEFMGYKTPATNDDNDGSDNVQAPVTRSERGGDGRPTKNTITLSPEQREIAKSMGVSDIEYAKQVQAFEAAKKADPEKYSSRG